MINLTRLLSGVAQPADNLRYGIGGSAYKSAAERKPVVVWNITRRCNLHCQHCYSDSSNRSYPGELTMEECRAVIDDLAVFGIPALLLSGGEPMVHPDFFEIASYARERGIRLTLSTNGTLLNGRNVARLLDIGFAYVGISLDGIGETHDRFRGQTGAFQKSVTAFRLCRNIGQKAGLRLTLTEHTVQDLDRILDFIEDENIRRVCFYHLVHSGRGSGLSLLAHHQTRDAMDRIMTRVENWIREGVHREVLTVDQPADGAYLWMHLKHRDPVRAERALELLRWNGGGSHGSGTGIANIDSQGNVHPDQFWQDILLGNVREKSFSRTWTDSPHPVLLGLRTYPRPVKGRCANCRFFSICGGGFRARAYHGANDPWAEDPGCYLTCEEIAPDRPC
jgi:radical SAM protein with 4Fe4S-binding SPASM domain